MLVAAPEGGSGDARRFYGQVIGLPELPKPEGIERAGAWFALGDRQLHVLEYEDFAAASRAHPALRVEPGQLDAIAGRLVEAGSEVRWDERLEDRRRFYTDDPWGNRLEVLAY